jgi:hypothetical protein
MLVVHLATEFGKQPGDHLVDNASDLPFMG